jgi:hypothetical protein
VRNHTACEAYMGWLVQNCNYDVVVRMAMIIIIIVEQSKEEDPTTLLL